MQGVPGLQRSLIPNETWSSSGLRTLQSVGRWVMIVAFPRRQSGGRPRPWLAWTLRLGGLALVLVGFGFTLRTGDRRLTPLPVQVCYILAIQTYAAVGFWILTRSPTASGRQDRIGWMFSWAAFLGSLVYACGGWAGMIIEGEVHLPGAVVLGWLADVLFLAPLALLVPWFAGLIPTGEWTSRKARRRVMAASALATIFSLLGTGFEKYQFARRPVQLGSGVAAHLHVQPSRGVEAPFAHLPLASASPWFIWGAMLILVVSLITVVFAIVERSRGAKEDEWRQLRWYGWGLTVALVGLPFYLWRPTTLTKTSGAILAVAISVAAVPAISGMEWQHGRLKRLFRASLVAAIVTGLHEVMTELLSRRWGEQAIYLLVLVAVAILLEPTFRLMHRCAEWMLSLRDSPSDVLEEALEDLRASRRRLTRAADIGLRRGQELRRRSAKLARAGRSVAVRMAASRQRRAIERILNEIREESTEAVKLIQDLSGSIDILKSFEPGADGREGGVSDREEAEAPPKAEVVAEPA